MDKKRLSSIYSNLPPRSNIFCHARLMDIEAVPTPGHTRPRLHISLLTARQPSTGFQNIELSSIIYPSSKSTPIWEAFCKTFRIEDGDYKAAIGRVGSIRVKAAEYDGTEYGQVGYVNQPDWVKDLSIQIERNYDEECSEC